jgi:hypothetical protein
VADDGTPRAELALTAATDQTGTAGQALAAQLGSVTGGVTDSAGYHARVQWGDGTVAQDATVGPSGAIGGTHTYAQPGTYTVHVTAWDTLSSITATVKVTVAGASSAASVTTTLRAPAPAARPAYHPRAALSVTAGPRATAITVDGSGFAPNETVSASFGAALAVTTLHANADGVISGATVSVPGAAVPGATGITLTGAGSATRVELPFTVTAPN